MTTMLHYRPYRTIGPAELPVTVAQAKKQLELSPTGSVHDQQLSDAIEAATEQVETDTNYALLDATYTFTGDCFPTNNYDDPICLGIRPIQSISSITYYDTDNVQQNLSTDVYALDQGPRQIHLKYDQEWPSITHQRSGIVITALCGFGSTAANVPRILRQAVLLQVAKWFEDREMLTNVTNNDAYERIIRRVFRASYP